MGEDTKTIINEINSKYQEIANNENTSNALDFISEIVDYLQNNYNI